MSFAKTYLDRYASGPAGKLVPPDPDVFFIVVIPVYDEPDLKATLHSIINSDDFGFAGEVIFVLNRPEDASESSVLRNERTRKLINHFKTLSLSGNWTIHMLEPDPFHVSKAGPGLARKIGMDEAIRRFAMLDRPDGILISIDSDTVVAHDYFFLLSQFISEHKVMRSYTCYFEHPLSNPGQSVKERQGITEYEIYLRVVKLALSWAGFPMSIYSLGSAFGVDAQTYVKVGGMGVQPSGEDFYFLHKCIQQGGLWQLNSLRVFPSASPSDRVLFGTGVFVKEYAEKQSIELKKYSWRSFQDLRSIMFEFDKLKYPFTEMDLEFKGLDNLFGLLERLEWKGKILSAMNRSGSEISFKKWLWREINGFQMVRFLNEHQKEFGSQAIMETASGLLQELNQDYVSGDRESILSNLREYERSLGDYPVY